MAGFAELLQSPGARRAAEKAAKDPDLAAADTDARFLRVMAAASSPRAAPAVSNWKSASGAVLAKITRTAKGINVAFDSGADPAFGEFVASRLDRLYSDFQSHKDGG